MRTCRTLPLALLGVLLATLPACQITWREPVIEPINTNRFYDAEIDATCDAVEEVVRSLGLAVEDSQREETACLLETEFRVFSDTGEDPLNHLRRVAFVGVGGFIGGRYAVTATTRDVRNGGTRVRLSTRIEGYVNEEFGYQVLRSNGLIEERVFTAIGEQLGAPAVEGR